MIDKITHPAPDAGDPMYQLIGQITRQLHEALEQLGVMGSLQQAADGLTDARHRLNYIADKSAAAADKVLSLVDLAKAEHRCMNQTMREIEARLRSNAAPAVESGTLKGLISRVDACRDRSDAHLTEIMLAQDFHDLTGQVVVKVISLAADLEEHLVKLLVRAAPGETTVAPVATSALQGPVVRPRGGNSVVNSQGEVDELLASLGF